MTRVNIKGHLRNPVALSGIGGLAVVRGVSYIVTGLHILPLGGHDVAPTIPGVGLDLVGTTWLAVGVFFWVGMVYRRFFSLAVATMTAMYATWALVHIVDLFTAPDWDSILNLAVYALMVPVTITLGLVEVEHTPENDENEV